MKITAKSLLTSRTASGFMKTIATLRLNIKIRSPDALPYEMFIHGMSSEASETFRSIRNEFERNRSLNAIETRQATCRC